MIKNRFFRWFIGLILFSCAIILLGNIWMIAQTDQLIFQKEQLSDLQEMHTGLVLGTSRFRSNGNANPYFENRIKAATELYQSGKVKHLLLSGSSQETYYNEPRTMREALLENGIPDSIITMDPDGLRTITSVLRAHKTFAMDSVIVISNRFHLYRAIFIAEKHGMHAIGYACDYIPFQVAFPTRLRELIARMRALIDIYFFPTSTIDLTAP
ncbi:MAG: YdcF family protein [Deferribacteres bacterium]|nr:YdcF family protein [candidate division KSB1 bacterium]MCB9503439.1 YdcF family protein [Deferribacteres bacterium]